MDRPESAGRGGAVAFIQKVVTQRDLRHYGVKGMRWGIRRTKAQLEADGPGENSAAPSKALVKATKASTSTKSIKDLDNKELQELVNRLNLEKQYRQLTEKPKPKTLKRKAGEFIADLLLDIGKTEVKRVAGAGARLQIEKQLGKKGKVTREELSDFLEKQRNKKK